MKFRELPLQGAFLVTLEPHADVRGSFARTWCATEFAAAGLRSALVQCSLSRNTRRGTIRGMHMQLPPSQESKLVRCCRGRILDVIVDLRPDSRTFLQHCSVELSDQNGDAVYIPPLFAHGFQTLADDSDVFYQMSDFHAPALATGWRWNDPAFRISWPIDSDIVIGERDASYSDFDAAQYQAALAAIR